MLALLLQLLLLLLLLSPAAIVAKPASGSADRQFFSFQENFPVARLRRLLGQVSGVAIATNGRSFLFHRADRAWESETFDTDNHFVERKRGPIDVNVIVEMDKQGKPVAAYGKDLFYLPHGLTADKLGRLWATDVAKHQVIRLDKEGKPDLTLGEAFQPGSGEGRFCKPTKVAVADSGEFFVADGYCNNRIVKFDKDGKYLAEFGKKPNGPALQDDELLIPHGLSLLESHDLLCVADREHKRVQCFKAGLKDPKEFGKFVQSVDSGLGRVYDVDFLPNGRLVILHVADDGTSLVTVYNLFNDKTDTEFTFVPNSSDPNIGFGDAHAVSVDPRGSFLLVSSLSVVCDGEEAACFGRHATRVPYDVFKFNVEGGGSE